MSAREQLALSDIAEDVLAGLSATPKHLPPKLFYDQQGSALFDEITRLPEYYLTRTERRIFAERADEICAAAGRPVSVVELGAGTSSKTQVLLERLAADGHELTFYPVDVSPSAMESGARELTRQRKLRIRPIVADYTAGLRFLDAVPGPRMVLYIGSSIGNFDPPDASALLRGLARRMGAGDSLLLGTDLVKDTSVLLPAYDDAAGVTERFNKNVLARINRELGGRFDLETFRHVALWNAPCSRMEMHLESTREQSVPVGLLGRTFHFRRGERIHTENSYKYTAPSVQRLLRGCGLEPVHTWTDERQWFAVHLARPAERHALAAPDGLSKKGARRAI